MSRADVPQHQAPVVASTRPSDDAHGRSGVRSLRDCALDGSLVLAAIAFAIPSLNYPFGGDQGVHFYIGREWLRGALPYRDAFDYKPPGIFAVHALLIAIFGEQEWPIRMADVACVMALGVACWLLLSRRPRGALGLTCLATSLLYFGFFSFWDTAQCELWCVMFAAFGLVAAKRNQPAAAGIAMGAALLMKTPALLFVIVAGAILVRRQTSRASGPLLRFGVATVALPIVAVLYFAARGGLGAMAEALGGATWAYVLGARRVDSLARLVRESVAAFAWFNPYSTLVLASFVVAQLVDTSENTRAHARRYRLAFALSVAAYIGVAAQLKFYRYHLILLVPGLVLALGETTLWLSDRFSRAATRHAITCLLLIFPLSGEPARWWWSTAEALVESAAGTPRRTVLAHFAIPDIHFNPAEIKDVGEWLHDRTGPDDRILVRGFLPEIYSVAHRAAPSRFFWTTPLTHKARQYQLDEWLAEDRVSSARVPPPFIVVLSGVHDGPDSAEYYVGSGYVPETRIGEMTVLRFAPASSGERHAFGVRPL